MTEFDLPVMLTFGGRNSAFDFVNALEQAKEDVVWEQRRAEDGSVIVTILNIINLEEKVEREDLDV